MRRRDTSAGAQAHPGLREEVPVQPENDGGQGEGGHHLRQQQCLVSGGEPWTRRLGLLPTRHTWSVTVQRKVGLLVHMAPTVAASCRWLWSAPKDVTVTEEPNLSSYLIFNN